MPRPHGRRGDSRCSRHPTRAPDIRGCWWVGALARARVCVCVCAHRHTQVCTADACARWPGARRPLFRWRRPVPGLLRGRKMRFAAAHFLPASPAVGCLNLRCLCPPPSGLRGVSFTLMGKAGSRGSWGQGGTPAVIYLHAGVSGLGLGRGLGDGVGVQRDPPHCLWGCVVWGGKGRRLEKQASFQDRVSCLSRWCLLLRRLWATVTPFMSHS